MQRLLFTRIFWMPATSRTAESSEDGTSIKPPYLFEQRSATSTSTPNYRVTKKHNQGGTMRMPTMERFSHSSRTVDCRPPGSGQYLLTDNAKCFHKVLGLVTCSLRIKAYPLVNLQQPRAPPSELFDGGKGPYLSFGVDPGKKRIYVLGISSYNRNPEPKKVLKYSTPRPRY